MHNPEYLTTTTNVSVLYPKIMTAVETAMREARFGRQLVAKVNTDLIGGKGRTLTVPYRPTAGGLMEGAFLPYAGETSSGTAISLSYTSNEVTVTKLAHQFSVSQQAIDSVQIDIIKDHIQEVGEKLANDEDWMIMLEWFGAAIATITVAASATDPGSTFTLSEATYVLDVLAAREANATGTFHYLSHATIWYAAATTADHIFAVQTAMAAVTLYLWYAYQTSASSKHNVDLDWYGTNVTDPYSDKTNCYTDLITIRNEVWRKRFSPNIAILHFAHMKSLLTDQRFTDKSAYGGEAVVMKGEVGTAAGLKILQPMHTFAGAMMVLDTTRAGWLIMKRNLDMKVEDYPREDSYYYYFFMELIPAVIHEDAIAIGWINGYVY